AAMTGFSNKIRVRSAARKELEQLGKARTLWVSAASGISLLALVPLAVLMAKQQPAIVGGAFAIFAILVWLVARWKTSPIKAKQREIEELEAQAEAEPSRAESGRIQKDVLDRLDRLRLPSNAEALEEIAGQLEAAHDADRLFRLWKDAESRLQKSMQAAAEK